MQHPLIALWAHPRSMSTAFERIMRERGDCRCVHEPFMYNYYVEREVRTFPHFDVDPDRPAAFSDIVAMLDQDTNTQPVFFKDMAYYVVDGLPRYAELARRMRHVFLVREPRRSLMSYYKLDSEFLLEEAGYEAQWKLFTWLRDICDDAPLVLRAEDVQVDTHAALAAAWQHMGLDYLAHAFEWNSEEIPGDWQQVSDWHTSATTSGAIRVDGRNESDIESDFAKLVAAAPGISDYLTHHRPFYDSLCAVSWSSPANRNSMSDPALSKP